MKTLLFLSMAMFAMGCGVEVAPAPSCGSEGEHCCRELALVRAGHACNSGLVCRATWNVPEEHFCISAD
jgi:hypothetical protein